MPPFDAYIDRNESVWSKRNNETMSLKSIPLLYLNLGGEMLYILDQRLRAQNIPQDKSKRVLHDILCQMLAKPFVVELFKPQEIYSKKAMRTVFDHLAHSSIMRLNTASMDKLFDLMTMAVKYQLTMTKRSAEILLVTLNHFDTVYDFVQDNATCRGLMEDFYKRFSQTYSKMNPGELQTLRQTQLNFFQDMHIRVSIFLKDKVQNQDGGFVFEKGGAVPHDVELPGTIRVIGFSDTPSSMETFSPGEIYQLSEPVGSIERHGCRRINLGKNMYANKIPASANGEGPPTSSADAAVGIGGSRISRNAASKIFPSKSDPCGMKVGSNPLAEAELRLLSTLVGAGQSTRKGKKEEGEFKLNLFNDEDEEQEYHERQRDEPKATTISIDASSRRKNEKLSKIMNDMSLDGEEKRRTKSKGAVVDKGEDLLDLMDQL